MPFLFTEAEYEDAIIELYQGMGSKSSNDS